MKIMLTTECKDIWKKKISLEYYHMTYIGGKT